MDYHDIPPDLTDKLSHYPDILRSSITAKVLSLAEKNPELFRQDETLTLSVIRAIAVSDFLYRMMLRLTEADGEASVQWLSSSRFKGRSTLAKAALAEELAAKLRDLGDEAAFGRALREFRNKHMFAIVFRDLVLRESFQVTAREVSWLAEVCIDAAINWHSEALSTQLGYPLDPLGNPQQMVVLGMGKLGAGELNVSSDIDLIFAFPGAGSTAGGKRSLDNQSYFVRLGQKVIQSLDKMTPDGFVFRVDMRLRPYGRSGALALSFAAMEAYYADQGRDWERYAMIKAAPVAGNRQQGVRLMAALRPFIYRKYVDYGVIHALRSMKAVIARDVRRKGMERNIKVGDGGIREIEFIVQVFQLIRGGRDTELQQRALLTALSALKTRQLLPPAAADELRDAYLFLRNLEHAIQGLDDQQTQVIPDDGVARIRVALAMGFKDWEACAAELNHHRQRVSEYFAGIISEPAIAGVQAEAATLWRQLWLSRMTPAQSAQLFPDCTQADIDIALTQLAVFRANPKIMRLQAQGRERLDEFMPRLLEQFAAQRGDRDAFSRLLRFVETVARRSAYLALLNENPRALTELIRLFAASSWVAEQIIGAPVLLDELLHTASLYSPPELATLNNELRQQIFRIGVHDMEAQMEALRYFKKAHVLRVAASELRGTLPLMKVSDYLTYIAETILNQVLELAWSAQTARYGIPVGEDKIPCDRDFAIVAYGKLGGIELGYQSDLDLVFLHDSPVNGETRGGKSITNQLFFNRLGQKIIHLLTTRTVSGDIYEVDMRLRPSGNSGLLVTSVGAFGQYQRENAWTWEHQALVRARFICGSRNIEQKFTALRKQVMMAERDHLRLRDEVLTMRSKMHESREAKPNPAATDTVFNLKHDPGGIVDIEFMVQYAALRWSSVCPSVADWSDNIRILETLAANDLMPHEETVDLCEIYRIFRSRGHLLALQRRPADVSCEEFVKERNRVTAIWQRLFDL